MADRVTSRMVVTVRCHTRSVSELLQMQSPKARMQDRVQLQENREEIETCRDGKGD